MQVGSFRRKNADAGKILGENQKGFCKQAKRTFLFVFWTGFARPKNKN
jgi:hypothetical protein